MRKIHLLKAYNIVIAVLVAVLFALCPSALAVVNPQDSGIGLSATLSSPAPTQAATITSPANGAVFTSLPITVSGFCPNDDYLVKIYKNNVFSGSAMCSGHSYSVQIDLFSGRNDLMARVYDSLDQAGPDSNQVSVTFNDNTATSGIINKISLSSNYARRGANPKEELTWPIIISGGMVPFAISVDWGDASITDDLYSVISAGEFTVKHTYDQAGVYRVLVKATDAKGSVAYLQLVAIGNGEVTQSAAATSNSKTQGSDSNSSFPWQFFAILIPVIISTFWLGKKNEKHHIKKRIETGQSPF